MHLQLKLSWPLLFVSGLLIPILAVQSEASDQQVDQEQVGSLHKLGPKPRHQWPTKDIHEKEELTSNMHSTKHPNQRDRTTWLSEARKPKDEPLDMKLTMMEPNDTISLENSVKSRGHERKKLRKNRRRLDKARSSNGDNREIMEAEKPKNESTHSPRMKYNVEKSRKFLFARPPAAAVRTVSLRPRIKYQDCGLAPLNSLTSEHRRRQNVAAQGYIVNGNNQTYGENPSFVTIITNYGRNLCSGVLISHEAVLTAGHCLFYKNKRLEDASLRIRLGDHHLPEADEHEVISHVRQTCLPDNYDRSPVPEHHDFATLMLKEPVPFTDYVQPACLPDDKTQLDLQTCHIVGVGYIEKKNARVYKSARKVQVASMRQVNCKGWPGVNEKNFCWSLRDRSGDTCDGDSGGPILCLDTKDRRWHVIGLTSYGSHNCDGSSEAGWTAVYSNLRAYRDELLESC